MNVLLIFGGASPEHEVSIRSAKTIFKALRAKHNVYSAYITKDNEWHYAQDPDDLDGPIIEFFKDTNTWNYLDQKFTIDVAFPIVHGVGGEDGTLQAKLDNWGVKYVGTKSNESALCFDKKATKDALRTAGINVVDEIVLNRQNPNISFEEASASLGSIIFVKPARSGSSVGVHKIIDGSTLKAAVTDAFKYDDTVLLERAVTEPRELEMAVLEVAPQQFTLSEPGEIVPDDDFYSYEAKYAESSQSKTDVKPVLPDKLKQELKEASLKANDVLGCRGLVRVDFLYDTVSDVLYLNEVNTLPGFTNISMYPMLMAGVGYDIESLVDVMVRVAQES